MLAAQSLLHMASSLTLDYWNLSWYSLIFNHLPSWLTNINSAGVNTGILASCVCNTVTYYGGINFMTSLSVIQTLQLQFLSYRLL